jgi:hypothetical protein
VLRSSPFVTFDVHHRKHPAIDGVAGSHPVVILDDRVSGSVTLRVAKALGCQAAVIPSADTHHVEEAT